MLHIIPLGDHLGPPMIPSVVCVKPFAGRFPVAGTLLWTAAQETRGDPWRVSTCEFAYIVWNVSMKCILTITFWDLFPALYQHWRHTVTLLFNLSTNMQWTLIKWRCRWIDINCNVCTYPNCAVRFLAHRLLWWCSRGGIRIESLLFVCRRSECPNIQEKIHE